MRILSLSFAAGCAALLSLAACAQDRPPSQGDRPHGPPPEAIAACKGKAVGDTVSFTGRRGETLKGTCEKAGDVLAARPQGGPPHGPRDGNGAPPQ
jgi:hypothetical protein